MLTAQMNQVLDTFLHNIKNPRMFWVATKWCCSNNYQSHNLWVVFRHQRTEIWRRTYAYYLTCLSDAPLINTVPEIMELSRLSKPCSLYFVLINKLYLEGMQPTVIYRYHTRELLLSYSMQSIVVKPNFWWFPTQYHNTISEKTTYAKGFE